MLLTTDREYEKATLNPREPKPPKPYGKTPFRSQSPQASYAGRHQGRALLFYSEGQQITVLGRGIVALGRRVVDIGRNSSRTDQSNVKRQSILGNGAKDLPSEELGCTEDNIPRIITYNRATLGV